MKTLLTRSKLLATLTLSSLAVSLASADTFYWTGLSGIDLNWATAGNWSPSGPPLASDLALFGVDATVSDATTVNNTVAVSATVAALSYTNSSSGTWHVTEIPTGNTLTVNGPLTVGGGVANSLVTSAAMVGGGTLVVNGSPMNVGNNGSSSLDQNTVLNLSGLSTFVFDAPGGTIATGTGNRSVASIILASVSNSITAGTLNLNTASSSSSGNSTALRFGDGTNIVNVNTMNISANRSSATVNFLNASGGLRVRGAGGTDANRANMVLGNRNAGSSSPATSTGTLALNGHPVDLLLGTVTLGANNRNGTEAGLTGAGVFQFDEGIVDVTTLLMGVCNGNSPTATARGTLTVGAAGTLNVGSISMGNIVSTGVGANASGTLNISGGVVNCVGNIVKTTGGLTTNTIAIDSGGRLNLGSGGRIGTPALPTDVISLSDATLRLNPASNGTNVVVTSLTTGGAGNIIEIGLVPSISSYPVTFRLIQYSDTIQGAGFNFTLAGLPGVYTGSLVDNAGESAVDLVITAGPVAQAIKWNGNLSGVWDILGTKNWLLGGNSTNYFDGDFVTFDDTASGNTTINLTQDVVPGSVTVDNSGLAYTLTGSGRLSGLTGLVKQGSGTFVLNNSGVNDFGGSITISGGTLQVGSGGTTGSLGGGAINNSGDLVINRSDDVILPNVISGAASGTLTKQGAGILTLTGANTFTGAVTVAQGTLKVGNASALGRTNGATTISSGATLDVNDLNLGLEPVFVSGAGLGGQGAIVENTGSGAFNQANLANVTLLGDTTFGGTGRWDLRSSNTADPTLASLSTGGQPYKLTKVGTNGIYLPGVTIDPALGDVDVVEGTLAVESATTGLGNPASNLVVHAGATFQVYNLTNLLNKVITLNGTGTNTTFNNANGNCVIVGPMTLIGDCVFNAGGTSLTLSNIISGPGGLIKTGTTLLTLAGGPDSYAGNTTLSNGILVINTTVNGGGTLTTVAGTTLNGNGSHTGPVVIGGLLSPGVGAGTFASGMLTLQAGATLQFDLAAVNTVGGGVNDLIQVTGDLTANNNVISLNLLSGQLQPGTYRLITYTGNLVGSFDPTVTLSGGASRYGLALDTATPGEVNLVVSGSAGKLVWSGLSGTAWDINMSPNWINTGTSLADVFYQGDSVLLDDNASSFTLDIAADTAVIPAVITNNSANYYTINGPGKISGGASIVKRGDGTLTIASSNDFTGVVSIEQGTVQVANNGALGSIAGATVVTSGGSLDVGNPTAAANAVNLGTEPITVSGTGYLDQGAIINNTSVNQQNAVRVVTLAGNASLGGSGRWDIRGAGATLSTGGNAYNLTKVGGNQVSLVAVAVDEALGDIDVQGGTLSIETSTTSIGNPNKNLTVESGATLQVYQLANPMNKKITLNGTGAGNTFFADNGSTAQNLIVGPIVMNGECWIGARSGNFLTLSNTITGSGGLVKVDTATPGTGTLRLMGNVSYSGNTEVRGGTLALFGPASIASSPLITLGSGTILDVSGRVDGKQIILGGHSLIGDGTIIGGLQVDAGATISPGNELLGLPIGRIAVSGAVTLSGTNVLQTDKSTLTNDVISGASIELGGVLNVVDYYGVPYVEGDAFQLFSAGSYSGSFSSILPATPGAGLYWDTSELAATGILKVVSTPPPPVITNVYPNGGNLNVGGFGGAPNTPYYVLSSTNLALALTNWTSIATNNFDSSGNFLFSTPIVPGVPQSFFLLQLP